VLALAALRAGKALLVEKAFTATTAGAAEVVDLARGTGVFVMEAMWTRFLPAVVALRELVADGAIGEVRSVQADLGVAREYDPTDRLFDLALGGGALLDLGVYVVSFAQMLLGTPERVVAAGSLFPSGADAEASLLLDYGDGRAATLTTSLRNALPGQARVFGTTGWIDVLPRFHHPETIVLHRVGTDPETITRSPLGAGYAHELIEVTECVRAGRAESSVMPLADTLAVQTLLGEAAEQIGVRHAEDAAVLPV
jgi:predicted dehydrogenase